MKIIASILLLTTISLTTFSQRRAVRKEEPDNTTGRSSFFAEAGGAGIAFSANFDTRFTESRLGWGIRAGVGFVSADRTVYDPNTGWWYSSDPESAITVPAQINYIFGKRNSQHTFEAGAGATYVSKKLDIMDFYQYGYNNTFRDRRSQLFGTFSFMYRRQPVNGGFSWRAGFTPLFAKGLIQPFAGVSVGYNF